MTTGLSTFAAGFLPLQGGILFSGSLRIREADDTMSARYHSDLSLLLGAASRSRRREGSYITIAKGIAGKCYSREVWRGESEVSCLGTAKVGYFSRLIVSSKVAGLATIHLDYPTSLPIRGHFLLFPY